MEVGHLLVVDRKARNRRELPSKVVGKVPQDPTGERDDPRRELRAVEAREGAASAGKRVRPGGRTRQDLERIGDEDRPASCPPGARALEEPKAREVPEPLGGIDRRHAIEDGKAFEDESREAGRDDSGRAALPRGHLGIIDIAVIRSAAGRSALAPFGLDT
jgi:hypothetical protein